MILANSSDKDVALGEYASWANSLNFGFGYFPRRSEAANVGDGEGFQYPSRIFQWINSTWSGEHGGTALGCYVQNGTKLATGAVFISAAIMKPSSEQYTVEDNGFDLARDYLVGNATKNDNTTDPETKAVFGTKLLGYDKTMLQGLSENNFTQNIGTDGRVAILEVKVLKQGAPTTKEGNGQSGLSSHMASAPLMTAAVMVALAPVISFF